MLGTPDRWEWIQELYHAARARSESERGEFLDDDKALRRDVQALLDQPVSTRDFVEFVSGPSSGVTAKNPTDGPLL